MLTLLLLLAISVSLNIYALVSSRKYDGHLYFNTSNPDKDIFRLVVDGDIEELPSKKKVTFKVVEE